MMVPLGLVDVLVVFRFGIALRGPFFALPAFSGFTPNNEIYCDYS
jgi:hypothetical protein